MHHAGDLGIYFLHIGDAGSRVLGVADERNIGRVAAVLQQNERGNDVGHKN